LRLALALFHLALNLTQFLQLLSPEHPICDIATPVRVLVLLPALILALSLGPALDRTQTITIFQALAPGTESVAFALVRTRVGTTIHEVDLVTHLSKNAIDTTNCIPVATDI
jgi:hypothetical protein